ncbi:hemerythrin domain-containing protein [Virgibacillus sp. 179-BFC.A HS]|uniref:Hemerythrin domain-containing protein n=1 Tax=Tigheibacillus jepli TaxID=3035914 RepID=A0ABU5CHC2_9BACI|nr:hemerythrin domain-containing protein [Virgibacillus sp. 179-BFC.A HS]MDY0405757.1 hemerythrin domain-containing protein [Virgibacillus sp. 179-BFC.A HS]
MSGPALRHADSHSAIHEAALNEARELTNLLDRLVNDNILDKALEVAYVIVEHWQTRTLQHAASEESGLYKELVESDPSKKDAIIELTRDHDLLRLLVKEIKVLLQNKQVDDEVVQRFQALILVDQLHNEAEEKILPEH